MSEQQTVVFTDGASKGNPGPGGWGVIIVWPDGRVTELGGGAVMTTNNKMELTGAIEALSRLRGASGPVSIYTDSTYVIQGIRAWVHGWKRRGWKTAAGTDVLNRELWERLDDLAASRGPRGIAWHYVRGHVGIPGNERVDEIADSFATQKPVALYDGPLSGYPVPILDLPDDTTVPARSTPSSGGAHPRRCLLVPQRRGRQADAACDVERVRAAREGTLRRAVQEGHEPGGAGGDPALLALRARRRVNRRAQHIFMTLRKILFWCHLAAGATAGAVILIMSVTGVLLTYERQISWWTDTRHYSIQPPQPDAPRRSISSLIVGVHEAEPRGTFTTMTVRADPLAPVAFAAADRTVYVNPYTGHVMGNGSPRTRRFFRAVTDWHRTLAFTGARRPLGRAITGACNLAFLFLVSSGLWLWWPRAWTRRHLRSVTTFHASLRGRARDFNWHNVVGFWSAIPLIVIVLGASVISYPWATNMVYRLVGETRRPLSARDSPPPVLPASMAPPLRGPTMRGRWWTG